MSELDKLKSGRIYKAFKNGCVTVSDVEVELNFTMTRHHISAHVANLRKQGLIVRVGKEFVTFDIKRADSVFTGRVPAYRYAVAR